MTKITIEVDGSAAVQTQAPVTPVAQAATTTPAATGGIDAGGAPYADASHVGPFPFTSAPSATQHASFSPEGAISAGSAPAHLMMVLPKGGAQ
jgi:hypothetical protein